MGWGASGYGGICWLKIDQEINTVLHTYKLIENYSIVIILINCREKTVKYTLTISYYKDL